MVVVVVAVVAVSVVLDACDEKFADNLLGMYESSNMRISSKQPTSSCSTGFGRMKTAEDKSSHNKSK